LNLAVQILNALFFRLVLFMTAMTAFTATLSGTSADIFVAVMMIVMIHGFPFTLNG